MSTFFTRGLSQKLGKGGGAKNLKRKMMISFMEDPFLKIFF